MKRLGINIDHVATVRNARGETHPSPFNAAKLAMKYGATSITIHLREDRRHINDLDMKNLCKIKKIPINLEISTNFKILKIALLNRPPFVCLSQKKEKKLRPKEVSIYLKIKKKLKSLLRCLRKKK